MLAAIALMSVMTTPLRAQTSTSESADSVPASRRLLGYEASVRLRPRVTTSSESADEPVRWELQRVRMQGRVRVGAVLQSRLQLDYAPGEWSVDDAWVQAALPSGARVLVGQAKRPFTVISMRSGSSVGTVSRGGSIRGAKVSDEQNLVNDLEFGDRAVGVQVSAPIPLAAAPLSVQAGIFPRDAFRAPLASGAQASARVTAEVAHGVTLGGAWSSRILRAPADSAGIDREHRGSALGLDIEVGDDAPGIHLLGEMVAGAAEQRGEHFYGAHAWLLYRTMPTTPAHLTWEPLLRMSTAGGGLREGAGTLVTPGLNLYVGDPGRWNRLMVNYDVWLPSSGGRAGSLKVQLQLGIG